MKQFVKALSLDSECFQHLVYAFPDLSHEKIKAGVFDEPQIRTLVRDQEFVQKMNAKEKAAWLAYEDVIKNFLGNKKAQNYEILVSEMLFAFRDLGCKMSIKVHFCSVTWTNSQKTLESSVTNRGSDSTRTTRQCW